MHTITHIFTIHAHTKTCTQTLMKTLPCSLLWNLLWKHRKWHLFVSPRLICLQTQCQEGNGLKKDAVSPSSIKQNSKLFTASGTWHGPATTHTLSYTPQALSSPHTMPADVKRRKQGMISCFNEGQMDRWWLGFFREGEQHHETKSTWPPPLQSEMPTTEHWLH